jgi:hypothetical protein
MQEMKILLNFFSGNHKREMLFGRSRYKREDNNKMNHNKGELEADWIPCGSGLRQLFAFCEHGKEFSGSALVENFLTTWPTATLSIGL